MAFSQIHEKIDIKHFCPTANNQDISLNRGQAGETTAINLRIELFQE